MEENLYFKHGNFKNWLLKEPKLKKGDFMKNKILATILLLASCVFAQYEYDQYGSNQYGADPYGADSYTQQTTYSTQQTEYSAQNFNPNSEDRDPYRHVHRGFYFAPSLTAAYTTLKHTETYRSKHEYTADAFMFPYLEIRLGGSIAGIASIYGALGIGTGTGTLKQDVKSNNNDYYSYYDDDDDYYSKIDATMLRLHFGAGVDFYPIQDKENPMYGLFAGLTVGIMIDGAFYKRSNDRDYTDDETFINYAFRFEVGKDWWFSRRWSVGIAFNYTLGKYSESDNDYYDREKDEYSGHTFGLTVRLAH